MSEVVELNKVYNCNCLDGFKMLADESIDCVITSPPYWQLRDKRSMVEGGVLSGGKTSTNEYSTNKVAYNPNGKNPGSVSDFWDIPTKGSSDSHYASYSTNLIDKPIIAGCHAGGIILDPFCGTATTGCRAIDLQRNFIGFEGSEQYVNMANKKLLLFQITQKLF